MTLVSPEGVVLTANRALCSMLRCTEDDLRGRRYELLTHPDDVERHTALFDEMIAGARSDYQITKRCQRADGTTLWGELSTALLRSDDDEPLYVIGQLHDVTPQREREEQLAEALEVIKRQRIISDAIFDTVDVGLLLIDRDGKYEGYNRRHLDFLNLAFPDGHLGQSGQLGEVYAADGKTLISKEEMPSYRAAQGEEYDDFRMWVGADPLTRRALAVSARSVRDEDGAFAGAALAYSDITDLMRALHAREQFLADVSHELRTPLTSVVGHLEVLLEHEELSAEVARQVRVAHRNAGLLRHLVSDLLESAQHRGGTVVLSRTPVDVAELVAEAVESGLPAARAAGIEVAATLPDRVVTVVDHQRLRQVVDNLVSNAVKYTDRGGRVDLCLDVDDDQIVLRVADTGIGIEPGDLGRLFTPFFRARQARERLTPGVGLGLGIAEAIVVAHGGRLAVSSEVGVGTTFTLTLPLVVP